MNLRSTVMKAFKGMTVGFFLLGTLNATAQLELPEDKVSWKFSVKQDGENAEIIVDATCVPGWHIYAANLPEGTFTLPTTITLESSSKFKQVGKVLEPKPHFEHDELADEDLYYHSGTVRFRRKIKVLSEEDFKVKGTFEFQTCDDTHCLPPHRVDFSLKVKGAGTEEADTGDIEKTFTEVKGDEAKDKDGNRFVKVNDEWHQVPEGNSTAFYKKYLTISGK